MIYSDYESDQKIRTSSHDKQKEDENNGNQKGIDLAILEDANEEAQLGVLNSE